MAAGRETLRHQVPKGDTPLESARVKRATDGVILLGFKRVISQVKGQRKSRRLFLCPCFIAGAHAALVTKKPTERRCFT